MKRLYKLPASVMILFREDIFSETIQLIRKVDPYSWIITCLTVGYGWINCQSTDQLRTHVQFCIHVNPREDINHLYALRTPTHFGISLKCRPEGSLPALLRDSFWDKVWGVLRVFAPPRYDKSITFDTEWRLMQRNFLIRHCADGRFVVHQAYKVETNIGTSTPIAIERNHTVSLCATP